MLPIRHSFPKDACKDLIVPELGQYVRPIVAPSSRSLSTVLLIWRCLPSPFWVLSRNGLRHRICTSLSSPPLVSIPMLGLQCERGIPFSVPSSLSFLLAGSAFPKDM